MTKNDLPLVLISHKLPVDWITSLSGKCRLLICAEASTNNISELTRYINQAEGLFTLLTIKVDEDLLAGATNLRVVSNMAAGVDNIDISACSRRGIPVGNTPGVLTEGTADLTFALLLSIARNLPKATEDAKRGNWKTWSPTGWLGADLSGATLGIIGMGKIGQAVARRALGFGMQIIYMDTQPCNESEASRLAIDELLIRSDFVSLHVPFTIETRDLINAEKLALMKSTAFLINTSRGQVVDLDALNTALREGKIAGAALDVTNPEPLPPDHPLYQVPNCLILPHIGSATHHTRRRMAELACANLIAGLDGKQLPHCVNPEVYQSKQLP